MLGNLKEILAFKSYKESKRGEGKGIEIFVAREYGRFQNSFLCYTRALLIYKMPVARQMKLLFCQVYVIPWN